MQNPSVTFIQTQSVLPQNGQPLKDGESVFVRVLQDKGGSYLVSFAGSRFNVQSERTLTPGETFPATLKLADGKLFVVPKETITAPLAGQEAGLFAALESLGLPAQEASVFLVQFLQQGGFKIDVPLIKKALSFGAHFPGKEKKASEIALMLLKKGIEPSESLIQNLMLMFENSGSGTGGENSQNPQKDEEDEKTFLDNIFKTPLSKNEAGLLTLVNQVSADSHHWFFLPYEWNSSGENKSISASGMMRLLLDTENNQLLRLVLDANTLAYKHFFVLYYEQGELARLTFCTEPPLNQSEAKEAGALLSSFVADFNGGRTVDAVYDEAALVQGVCTVGEPPVCVSGVA